MSSQSSLVPGPPGDSPFEKIRQTTDTGGEYWSARDLAGLLGYTQWRNFVGAIEKARLACEGSDRDPVEHFAESRRMQAIGKGGQREVDDWLLSRYACYLVVQNADPAKPMVALGQTYFAVQTQIAEQAAALEGLNEAQRRIYLRGQMTDQNKKLADAAHAAGVASTAFAAFQNHGYRGLYGGEDAGAIRARKGLSARAEILDHMNAEELAANLFRATQAEAKIRRDGVQGEAAAGATHYQVGRAVRQTIAQLGGTMPEELPTPAESIPQLERKQAQRDAGQLDLFGDPTDD